MLQLQSGRRLSEFSTFGIGGPIHLLAEVSSIDEMQAALLFIRKEKIPYFFLGKGSNCLFDDQGFSGVVILNRIDFTEFSGFRVTAGSGAPFSLLGVHTAKKGLSGLEFASGIPASVGGAVFMNAGANGRETAESLESVAYLSEEGERRVFRKEDLSFGYRFSPFQQMKGVILSATFCLTPAPAARETQIQILGRRLKTQPYKDKSAGCVFRNPAPDRPAGLLIEQCGLKGISVGGAKVSEIHANFIVNTGQATSADVLQLIETIQIKVAEQTGIHLEPEIRVIHG